LYFSLFSFQIASSENENYVITLKKGWNMVSIPYETFKILKIDEGISSIAFIYNFDKGSYEKVDLSSLSSQVGAIWVYSHVDNAKIVIDGTNPLGEKNFIEMIRTAPNKKVWNFLPIPKGGYNFNNLGWICKDISVYYYNATDNCWYLYSLSTSELKKYCGDRWITLGVSTEVMFPDGIGVWLRVNETCHEKKEKADNILKECKFEFQSCSSNDDCCPNLVCDKGQCINPSKFYCEGNRLMYKGKIGPIDICKFCCEGTNNCGGNFSACCKDTQCSPPLIDKPICPGRCMEPKVCEASGGVCLDNFKCSGRTDLLTTCCCKLPCRSEGVSCSKHEDCCLGLKCIDGVCRNPEYCAKEDCSSDVSCQINKNQLVINGSIFGYKEKGHQGSCEKIGTKVCKTYTCDKGMEGLSVECKGEKYYCCLTPEGYEWMKNWPKCSLTCVGKVTLSFYTRDRDASGIRPFIKTTINPINPVDTVKPGDIVTAVIGGFSGYCKGKAYLKDSGGCENGKTIGVCEVSNSGCQIDFIAPTQPGTYTYYACFDMNSDGKYSSGEYDSKILKVKEACDSKSYALCNLAFDFGSSSGTKSNMCGSEQYYKVSTPAGQKCDVIWSISSDTPGAYYLYVKWENSCPSTNDFDCSAFTRFGRQKASCSLSEFSGTSYAVVKRNPKLPSPLSEEIERTYNITVLLANCKPFGS
jgi:hypothetical protein